MKINEKITYRGLLSLVLLVNMSKIFNPSLALILRESGRASWIMALLASSIAFALMYLAIRLMRSYPNQSILVVLDRRIGGWASVIFALLTFGGTIVSGGLNLRFLADQTKIVTLPNTPTSVLLFLSLVAAFLICRGGLSPLTRTTHVLLPWMLTIVISLSLLLFNRFDWSRLFPILGPGVPTILITSIRFPLYFCEQVGFLSLAHRVESQKSFERGILHGTLIAMVLSALMLFITVLVLGYPSGGLTAFPFLEMARLVNLTRFIQHLEGIYASVWLMIGLCHLTYDLYVATYTFSQGFRIKQYRPLFLPVAVLMYMMALSPAYFYKTLVWKELLVEWGGYSLLGSIILFSVLAYFRKSTNPTPSQGAEST